MVSGQRQFETLTFLTSVGAKIIIVDGAYTYYVKGEKTIFGLFVHFVRHFAPDPSVTL